MEYAAAKIKPAGLDRNREFFASRVAAVDVAEAMAEALYDPQTSGGLLLSVGARQLKPVLAALKRRRVWNAVIGEVAARRAHAIELTQR